MGDQLFWKISPQTVPEILAVSRGISEFIASLSPKKLEELQAKRRIRTSYDQGTFLISVRRLDVHLVKEENSKYYLSFIGIDVSLLLEQVINSSRNSISSQCSTRSLY
jgi:hypothetical protein